MSYDKAFLHDMYNLPSVDIVLSVMVGVLAIASVVVPSEGISTSILIVIYNNYDLTDFYRN